MEVDATTRHRLSLDARAALGNAAPALFARFKTVTKLALRWARGPGADSLSDYGAVAVTELIMAWGGGWGGGIRRGDGICALVVGDPLMATRMAWEGGWGGGVRHGAGIYALGGSRRRGVEPYITRM
jgi:hypothetical protein